MKDEGKRAKWDFILLPSSFYIFLEGGLKT